MSDVMLKRRPIPRDSMGRRLEDSAFLPTSMDCVVYDCKGRLVQSYFSQRRLADALSSRALTLKVGDVIAVVQRGSHR